MKSTGAWLAVGLFIALCGTACGSFLVNGLGGASNPPLGTTSATIVAPPPAMVSAVTQLPAIRNGAGNASFGGSGLRVRTALEVSCTGDGYLTVEISSTSRDSGYGTTCPARTAQRFALPAFRGARFEVQAPAKVHWTLSVSER